MNNLQKAYPLHIKPYRNTSCLVRVFTETEGLLSVVARGHRRKNTKQKYLLQLFMPVYLTWFGKTELVTLKTLEAAQPMDHRLTGQALLCGFYLNELLVRLLPFRENVQNIFNLYEQTLKKLSKSLELAPVLRYFEKQLLGELGYGLPLEKEAKTNQPIHPEKHYIYNVEVGFTPVMKQSTILLSSSPVFSGTTLLAISNNTWTSPEVLRAAKQLMRLALRPLLGNKPLKTRELWMRKDDDVCRNREMH